MARKDREKANLALKHRLYVPGWELSGFLRSVRDGHIDAKVSLYWVNEVPWPLLLDNLSHTMVVT